MFCPECRSEYRDGIAACAQCDVELIAELPPESVFDSPAAMARSLADRELQDLLVGHHVALQGVQRVLATHRIPSVIAGESEDVGASVHSRFYLKVAVEDHGAAQNVLADRWRAGLEREGTLATAETDDSPGGSCPACGADLQGQEAECADCGLFLGTDE